MRLTIIALSLLLFTQSSYFLSVVLSSSIDCFPSVFSKFAKFPGFGFWNWVATLVVRLHAKIYFGMHPSYAFGGERVAV